MPKTYLFEVAEGHYPVELESDIEALDQVGSNFRLETIKRLDPQGGGITTIWTKGDEPIWDTTERHRN